MTTNEEVIARQRSYFRELAGKVEARESLTEREAELASRMLLAVAQKPHGLAKYMGARRADLDAIRRASAQLVAGTVLTQRDAELSASAIRFYVRKIPIGPPWLPQNRLGRPPEHDPEFLVECRRQLGMTVKQVAAALGVSEKSVISASARYVKKRRLTPSLPVDDTRKKPTYSLPSVAEVRLNPCPIATPRRQRSEHMETHETPAPSFLPLVEACRAHGISRSVAFELSQSGLLKTFTIGTRRYVYTESLRTLPERLAANAARGGA